jgi:hypothetical protein
MSQLELYAVLRSLGVDDDKAKAAVEDSALVTKEFLKGELLDLKSSLLLWLFSMLVAFTGVVAAIVKWVK